MTAQETNIVNAGSTTLANTMAAGATSMTLTSAADAPAAPFYLVVDPDVPAKCEYMLVTSLVGTTASIGSGANRNLSGSAGDAEHLSGRPVRFSPPMKQLFDDLHDRTDLVLKVSGVTAGDLLYVTAVASGQATFARLAKGTAGQQLRMNSGATAPEWGKIDTAWSKTFGITGLVVVQSGANDYIVGFTVVCESDEVLTITRAYDEIRSGTSATYKITKNGSDQVTGIVATTTNNVTDIADFTAVDGDRIKIVVTAVSATPDGLEVTLAGVVSSID